MDRFLSSELHSIIHKLPTSRIDERMVQEIIEAEIPYLAPKYGLNFLMVRSTVPARNYKDAAHVSENVIYDAFGLRDNLSEYCIPHGDGGFTYYCYQLSEQLDSVARLEAEENLQDLFYIIHILIGRARSMSFMARALYTDHLTEIPNETCINKFIGEIHKAGRFSEFNSYFINIKDMQLINDQYGSRMGEEVIKAYAQNLVKLVGDDAIAGRLGGDNFFVFMNRKKHFDFLSLIPKVRLEVANPSANGRIFEIVLESRLGFSEMTDSVDLAEAMTGAAIARSFAGKGGRPDILCFTEDMLTTMRQKRILQASIPLALRNREFVVYYQPKAIYGDDGSFTLCGAEALIRWEKDGRLIMPNDFIPILEEMGLILDIDFYVFETVCRNIKEWIAAGYHPVRISSNFSQRHLQNEDFANQILNVIRKYNISPEFIEIEITESYDIHNLQKMTRFADRMHENGIRLSVDDFGSGYASFSMIKNISADTIKLDKSLVDGVAGGSAQDEIIVRNIIRMVEELGKDMIAEGVEYPHQANFLRECGCNTIQGFIYGKPMPEDPFLTQFLSQK